MDYLFWEWKSKETPIMHMCIVFFFFLDVDISGTVFFWGGMQIIF